MCVWAIMLQDPWCLAATVFHTLRRSLVCLRRHSWNTLGSPHNPALHLDWQRAYYYITSIEEGTARGVVALLTDGQFANSKSGILAVNVENLNDLPCLRESLRPIQKPQRPARAKHCHFLGSQNRLIRSYPMTWLSNYS